MEETRNCINLVMTVKKYPALYDLSCNDYHNRMVRSKMWKAVAHEVNATAATCKEKWRNLRAGFSRHLRNQTFAGSKSKKPYYMADYMDFLLPYSKPRRRNESMNEDTMPRDSWKEDDTGSEASSSYEKPNGSNSMTPEAEAGLRSFRESQTISRSQTYGQRINEDVDQPDRCAFNYVTTTKPRDIDESINDPDLLFFKSLLPDVRLMSRHEKTDFKISVLSLIDKILTQKTATENCNQSVAREEQECEKRD